MQLKNMPKREEKNEREWEERIGSNDTDKRRI